MKVTAVRRIMCIAASAAILAGCSSTATSSGSSGSATTSPSAAAPQGSSTAPMASAGSSAPASAGAVASSAPSTAGSSASVASSPAASSSSSSVASATTSSNQSGSDSVTDVAGLTKLAKKLGCVSPDVTAPKAGSSAAKLGGTAAAQCEVNGTKYLLAAGKNEASVPALVKSLMTSMGAPANSYYVAGPTWLALGSKTGDDAPKAIAEAIQAKIGGEVKPLN